jgi:hypothetical protein
VRFWDSSALIPLLVSEDTSAPLEALFLDEPSVAVWWGTEVECASALARLEREGKLTSAETSDVFQQLQELAEVWHVVDPVETIRVSANGFSASTISGPRMHSNSRPPSLPPKDVLPAWRSSVWMTGS